MKRCRQYALQAIEINSAIKAWRGVALNYELLNRCDLEQGLYEDAKRNLDTGMPYALQTERELCAFPVLCRLCKTPRHPQQERFSQLLF